MRPRKAKAVNRVLVLAALGWLLIAGAATARADIDPVAAEYAAQNAGAICATLDAYPSVGGVAGIAQAIVNSGYLSFYQAGQAIGISVLTTCPEHGVVIDRFVAAYAGGRAI